MKFEIGGGWDVGDGGDKAVLGRVGPPSYAENTTSLTHMDSASSGASILPRWSLCQRQTHWTRPGLAVSLHALDHLQQLADGSLDELDRRNLFGVLCVLNDLVLFL